MTTTTEDRRNDGLRSTPDRTGRAALGLALVAAATVRAITDPQPPRRRSGDDSEADKASHAPGRGRTADAPGEIPKAGWRDILWRVYAEISEDRILAVAAGVTFYILLALAPFLTAFVSVYGLFATPESVSQHLQNMSGLLPESALSILGDQMQRLSEKPQETLGIGFAVGLGIALWSANAGMKALIDALNVAYEEREERSFLRLTAVSLAFTLGAIVLLAAAAAVVVVLPIALRFVGLGQTTELVLTIVRWPLLLLVVGFAIAVLYRYGPDRRAPRWQWVSWGSAFAAVGFLVVSLAFSWYTTSFGNYDETYGSLGAVIAFMTWVWIIALVVLLGAEINSEIEHQTLRDSTVGPDRPMGERDAAMADTVGGVPE